MIDAEDSEEMTVAMIEEEEDDGTTEMIDEAAGKTETVASEAATLTEPTEAKEEITRMATYLDAMSSKRAHQIQVSAKSKNASLKFAMHWLIPERENGRKALSRMAPIELPR